ncbi:hypothetical protein [Neoroseomonas lacus]|uniref:hypothetical protein n=1 Tax=Neoroseomonas lacus TaxID=287609 RepID=UPI00166C4896|nr:hypothetical protein [Neoroseomonas lacus]
MPGLHVEVKRSAVLHLVGLIDGDQQEQRAMRAAAKMQDQRDVDFRHLPRPEPAPLSTPAGANAQQRAAFYLAVNELKARCRAASKVSRGWTAATFAGKAPPGCSPLVMRIDAKHARIAIDLRGRLRLVDGAKAGPVVSISEAAAIAAGR